MKNNIAFSETGYKHRVMRYVKIFVIDPCLELDLKARVLYEGQTMWTEEENCNLFYHVQLPSLVTVANEQRANYNSTRETKDKLPMIRIGDLKKVVTELARIDL